MTAPFPYVEEGTYFRFMNHHSPHFWPSLDDLFLRQELFLNSRVRFNDPFDSNPIIEDDVSDESLRNYFQDMIDNPINPRRSMPHVFKILE